MAITRIIRTPEGEPASINQSINQSTGHSPFNRMRGDIRNQLPSLDPNFEIPPHHSPKDGWTPEQSPENTDLNPWENVKHRQSFTYTRGNGQTVTATVSEFENGEYIITFPIGEGNTMAESLTPEELQQYMQNGSFSNSTTNRGSSAPESSNMQFLGRGDTVDLIPHVKYSLQDSGVIQLSPKNNTTTLFINRFPNGDWTIGSNFLLRKGESVIVKRGNGSAPGTLQIDSEYVSGQHATLSVDNTGALIVEDDRSTNGTKIVVPA